MERNIDVREKHHSVMSCKTCNLGMCLDQESNLRPFCLWDDAPTNCATGQGLMGYLHPLPPDFLATRLSPHGSLPHLLQLSTPVAPTRRSSSTIPIANCNLPPWHSSMLYLRLWISSLLSITISVLIDIPLNQVAEYKGSQLLKISGWIFKYQHEMNAFSLEIHFVWYWCCLACFLWVSNCLKLLSSLYFQLPCRFVSGHVIILQPCSGDRVQGAKCVT